MGGARGSFAIGDRQIAPGTREVVDLPVAMLSNHTPVVLSVLVQHGRRPGPVLFVSGAIHGDEVLGVEVIRRLIRSPALEGLAGTLLAVPVVNAFGFLHLSRYLPDRRDLNRSFPGRSGGSLAGQLAHLFMQEVVLRSDLGIDLHTGAVHRTNLPQIRLADPTPELAAAAEAFAPPVILKGRAPGGSLRAEAAEVGVGILLYEAGEALRFDEFAVRVGVRGALQVMRHLGMIGEGVLDPPEGPAPIWLGRSRWARAPQSGVVRNQVALGEVVAAGQTLGMVGDPFGQSELPVEAPIEGVVIGRSELSTANRGDALFNIGRAEDVSRVLRAIETVEEAVEDEAYAERREDEAGTD
jgi:predicted deacylase